MPLPIEAYKGLFPNVPWANVVRFARQTQVLQERLGCIELVDETRDALRENDGELRAAHEQWIAAIEPEHTHVDLTLSLALHYLSIGRIDDSTELLVEMAEGGRLGQWTRTYLSGLQSLAGSRYARRFSPELQLRLQNAIGLCLGHLDRHDEAYDLFKKVLARCRRDGNAYWLGQTFLNLGVTCAA